MLWQDLIIIFVTVSLIMVMKHLDTMPGYSCPKHCAVQHKHWDCQSDSDSLISENVKLSKNKDLTVK